LSDEKQRCLATDKLVRLPTSLRWCDDGLVLEILDEKMMREASAIVDKVCRKGDQALLGFRAGEEVRP
jgi:hypothetical protein